MATSSLASQLAQVRSLNASRLGGARGIRQTQSTSYLFPPSVAATQDFDTLHGLAENGWEELCNGDAAFSKWNASTGSADLLFGDSSRDLDRLTKTKEENAVIEEAIAGFLYLVGDNLLDKSAGKCIEWLVRRFRVHEFDVNVVLAAFLPFHETQEFAKMLQIVKLNDKPQFSFLLPVQKQGIPLPSSVLVSTLMEPAQSTASTTTLRWIVDLPHATKSRHPQPPRRPHHTLYSFWFATIVRLCTFWSGGDGATLMGLNKSVGKKRQTRDDDAQLLLSVLLPAVLKAVHDGETDRDAPVFGSMALCAIANAFDLSFEAAKGVITSIADVPKHSRKIRTALLGACACVVGRQSIAGTNDATRRLVGTKEAERLAALLGDGSALSRQSSALDLNPFFLHLGKALSDLEEGSGLGSTFNWMLESSEATSDQTAIEVVRYILSTAPTRALPSSLVDVLSTVRQRRPRVWEVAYREETKVQNADGREALGRVLGDVLKRQAGTHAPDGKSSAWTQIHSSESSVRTRALRSITTSIANGSIDANDKHVADTLSTCLKDQDGDVLSVLYEEGDVLIQSLGVDRISGLLENLLCQTEKHSRITRNAVSLHAAFLFGTLLQSEAATDDQQVTLWSKVIWPRLLIVKNDRKACQAFHMALIDKVSTFSSRESSTRIGARLLAIAQAVRPALEKEDWTKANNVMAKALGKSMALEDHENDSRAADALVSEAFGQNDSEAANRSRLLALSTLSAYLSHANGTSLKDVSSKIATHLSAQGSSSSFEGVAFAPESIDEAVYARPNSLKTYTCIVVNLLANLAHRCPLDGASVLGGAQESVAAAVFAVATKIVVQNPEIAFAVIDKLLARLGDASPVLLATLWAACTEHGHCKYDADVRLMAVRCAKTFFATLRSSSSKWDLQTLVPSLLLALKDSQKHIRVEALSALESVRKQTLALMDLQTTDIYGYDQLYGQVTADGLTYLDLEDTTLFLDSIVQDQNGFLNDASYLDIWMQSNIAVRKGEDKRRAIAYKGAIIHWLASHALCWENILARLSILVALDGLSHESKLRTLLPLVKEIAPPAERAQPEALVKLLFNVYDKSAKTMINEDQEGCWTTFKSALQDGASVAKKAAANALKDRTFAQLYVEKQIEVVALLADVIANSTIVPREVRECLVSLRMDTDSVLVPVLSGLRDSISDTLLQSQPSSKRNRIDNTQEAGAGLPAVGVLLQLLESNLSRAKKTSTSLISELFECLRLGTEMFLAKIPSSEQLLQVTMSNLQVCLSSANVEGEALSEPMRADAVINVIKLSCRPQTFQQALLLLSLIAQSNPSVALHHSMPIFTFVGSTMLQRDDEYSFHVIESTLQSILPPVVQDIRRNLSKSKAKLQDSALELQQASRGLLCIFTDAATHVPRHRRQNFFYSLSKVMGQMDYLAPIAMLLVDRQAYKAARLLSDDDKLTALQLPLSLFRRAAADDDVDVLLSCLNQVWNETMRTWTNREQDPIEMHERVFLDCVGNIDTEHEGRKMDPIKRVLALLYFARLAISDNREALEEGRYGEDEDVGKRRDALLQSIVQQALRLVEVDVASIAEAAQEALDELMTIVSVSTLKHVVTALLDSTETSLQRSGLQILSTSIVDLLDRERRQASEALTPQVLQKCKAIVVSYNSQKAKDQSQDDLVAALDALLAIASNAVSAEFGGLAEMMAPLCTLAESTREDEVIARVMALLERLGLILGPRLIPSLAQLIEACRSIMSSGNPARQQLAFGVLTSLIKSVPTFVSSHLLTLFSMCVDITRSGVSELTSRVRSMLAAVNRYLPPADVLQAIYTTYEQGSKSDVNLHLFCLDAVQLCIKSLDKRKTFTFHKQIFRFLVLIFDSRRQRLLTGSQEKQLSDEDIDTLEARAVGVFIRLVFRLNETVFRPLFLRLCDWSLLDLIGDDDDEESGDGDQKAKRQQRREKQARQIVLYKVLNALLGELGELVAHYYVNVLDATIEALQTLSAHTNGSDEEAATLWTVLVTSIKLSVEADNGTFWNAARAKKMIPNLVLQVQTPFVVGAKSEQVSRQQQMLAQVICSLCQIVSDESTVKLANDSLLDVARKEKSLRARLAAISVLEQLWRTKGCEDALLNLLPNTVPTIAELLQESEETLQQPMSGFVSAIEEILGEDLDSYLQ